VSSSNNDVVEPIVAVAVVVDVVVGSIDDAVSVEFDSRGVVEAEDAVVEAEDAVVEAEDAVVEAEDAVVDAPLACCVVDLVD
jgi:hypothetical protein